MALKRVVLARETTTTEIKRIHKASEKYGIELEVFCHGSLCYSYSGLCFFSGANDARSGNRGECAYTCRKPYKILNEPGHGFLFSMKDLDSSETLDRLIKTGVHTLKIEGRKKDAQYVTSVVRLYRKKLDELFGQSTLRDSAPDTAREDIDGTKVRNDLNMSYQRSPTTFFLEGRYRENAIDLDNPTHKGVLLGKILKFDKGWVQIKTGFPIEKYDGLRVDTKKELYHAKPQHGENVTGKNIDLSKKYDNDVLAFSLREMKVDGKFAHSADAGQKVWIKLPQDRKFVEVGDKIYKTRSASLKQRVESLTSAPKEYKLKPWNIIRAEINVFEKAENLIVDTKWYSQDRLILEKAFELPLENASKEGLLLQNLNKSFQVFGEQNFKLKELEINISGEYFVPGSKLKEIKREIGSELTKAYFDDIEKHKNEVKNSLDRKKIKLQASEEEKISIKIDRLEYLNSLESVKGIDEIIFEPKRAFAEGVKAKEGISRLKEFCLANELKFTLAVPTVVRAWDEPFLKIWFDEFIANELVSFELGNVGAVELIEKWYGDVSRFELSSDFTLYSFNSQASKAIEDLGVTSISLSVEDDFLNIKEQLLNWQSEKAVPRAILYKDTPLFIAEACSLTALHGGCPTAEVCGYRTLLVENDEGEKYHVAHENCKSIVFADEGFSIAEAKDDLKKLGVSEFRIDFLTRPYTDETIKSVIDKCVSSKKVEKTHSANFYRELL